MRTNPLSPLLLTAVLSLTPALGGPADAEPTVPLSEAVKRAREAVFPTLVHIRPIFDTSRGGKKIETQATGSGVVVREDGLVVTNFHVAGTAKRMICSLADRRRCTADLVGADAATDLAVVRLRLDELGLERLPCAKFASRASVETGNFVLAMGSPLGLNRSVSLGVVSCRERYLTPMTVAGHVPTGLFNTWIQTDAAINPGNSGGPLVDLEGRIVGINTRGYRGADNLGFAIPCDVVEEVFAAIVRDGRVVRSHSGLTFQPLNEMIGVFSSGDESGVLVASVEPDSPAAASGIRAGDVLAEYGGERVGAMFDEDVPDLRRRVAAVAVGSEVQVRVRRDGRELAFVLVTEEWNPADNEDRELEALGLTLRRLSDRERYERFLDGEEGLLVTGIRAGRPASRSAPRLASGDVLLSIDEEPVRSPQEVEQVVALARDRAAGSLVLRVRRGGQELLVAVDVDGSDALVGDRP